MRSGRVFWAVLLILAGVVLLLSNLGLFEDLNINVWALLGPLFLIALGIWIVFAYFRRSSGVPAEEVAIPLQGAVEAELEINHGAGSMTVSGGAAADVIASGTVAGGLRQRSRLDGQVLKVDMIVPRGSGVSLSYGRASSGLDWDLRLNDTVPLDLKFQTGGSNAEIDLSTLQVTAVKLETAATTTDVTLPAAAGFTRVKIQSAAARVTVRVPGGVAARIQTDAALANVEVDSTRFLPAGDNRYQSPDYANAANRVDIEVEAGVGSINIM